MKSLHHHILLFLLLVLSGPLAAQGLPSGEVDVIKDFNARLIETEKYDLRPELPPMDTTRRQQTYEVMTRMLNVTYPPPKIRPLALQKEENDRVYRGFARLGAGLPNAFYADGTYHLSTDEKFMLDLDAHHYSADNSGKLENQRFSNSNFKLDGTYFFEEGFAVRSNVGFERDKVFFYGYNDFSSDSSEVSFASDDVKQRFSTFNLGGEIFNGVRTQADFNYSAGFQYYHLQDLYSARENGFDLKIQGTKWFNDRHPLQVILRTDFTNYQDTAKQNLNNVFLQPSYTYHGDDLRVKIGVNLASSDDEFFFFPDLEVAYNLVENIFTLYAGANGSLQKNNFRNLSDYSPFVTSRPELRNTQFNYFFGGAKGEIIGIDYQAEAGYKRANNLALFLSDEDTIPRFNVLYDTVDIFVLKGELTMQLFGGLNITGSVAQNVFSPKTQEKAWHLPSLEVNFGATYVTLDNRLTLRADLFVENGVPYRDAEGKVGNLNALFDLSAGGEYMFTEQIGAFVRVNNILNNERERWHHYPVLGINALAGLSARF